MAFLQREPGEKPSDSTNSLGNLLLNMLYTVCIILVVLVCFYIVSAFLSGMGGAAGKFFTHIQDLVKYAPDFLKNKRGFSSFIELILIAVFLGWAINRIMKFMRRR